MIKQEMRRDETAFHKTIFIKFYETTEGEAK